LRVSGLSDHKVDSFQIDLPSMPWKVTCSRNGRIVSCAFGADGATVFRGTRAGWERRCSILEGTGASCVKCSENDEIAIGYLDGSISLWRFK
jgi:hypothetical protein